MATSSDKALKDIESQLAEKLKGYDVNDPYFNYECGREAFDKLINLHGAYEPLLLSVKNAYDTVASFLKGKIDQESHASSNQFTESPELRSSILRVKMKETKSQDISVENEALCEELERKKEQLQVKLNTTRQEQKRQSLLKEQCRAKLRCLPKDKLHDLASLKKSSQQLKREHSALDRRLRDELVRNEDVHCLSEKLHKTELHFCELNSLHTELQQRCQLLHICKEYLSNSKYVSVETLGKQLFQAQRSANLSSPSDPRRQSENTDSSEHVSATLSITLPNLIQRDDWAKLTETLESLTFEQLAGVQQFQTVLDTNDRQAPKLFLKALVKKVGTGKGTLAGNNLSPMIIRYLVEKKEFQWLEELVQTKRLPWDDETANLLHSASQDDDLKDNHRDDLVQLCLQIFEHIKDGWGNLELRDSKLTYLHCLLMQREVERALSQIKTWSSKGDLTVSSADLTEWLLESNFGTEERVAVLAGLVDLEKSPGRFWSFGLTHLADYLHSVAFSNEYDLAAVVKGLFNRLIDRQTRLPVQQADSERAVICKLYDSFFSAKSDPDFWREIGTLCYEAECGRFAASPTLEQDIERPQNAHWIKLVAFAMVCTVQLSAAEKAAAAASPSSSL